MSFTFTRGLDPATSVGRIITRSLGVLLVLAAFAAMPASSAQAAPAVTAGPTYTNLGQGLRMTTTARLSRADFLGINVISGHTRTWTGSWGQGGHGVVGVYLLDAEGNVIGASNAHRYGVDARSIFWGKSDRTDDWADFVPAEIAARTAALEISHTTDTVDNFQRILDEAKRKGCAIFETLGQTCPYK